MLAVLPGVNIFPPKNLSALLVAMKYGLDGVSVSWTLRSDSHMAHKFLESKSKRLTKVPAAGN